MTQASQQENLPAVKPTAMTNAFESGQYMQAFVEGMRIGISEGIYCGRHEANLMVSKKMIKSGFTLSYIRKLTSLHEDELRALLMAENNLQND